MFNCLVNNSEAKFGAHLQKFARHLSFWQAIICPAKSTSLFNCKFCSFKVNFAGLNDRLLHDDDILTLKCECI